MPAGHESKCSGSFQHVRDRTADLGDLNAFAGIEREVSASRRTATQGAAYVACRYERARADTGFAHPRLLDEG
jgi:hypothetical protein